MPYAPQYPNLLPVDPDTGGEAWMVGWTHELGGSVVADNGDGSADIDSSLDWVLSSKIPVTPGSTYTFAYSLDAVDQLSGGSADETGDDEADGGDASSAGPVVFDGGPALGPGVVHADLLFFTVGDIGVAATSIEFGTFVGDRGAVRATAPATAATVMLVLKPPVDAARVSHPTLTIGSTDPGWLDPVFTPEGTTGALGLKLSMSAAMSKQGTANALASLFFSPSTYSGDLQDAETVATLGLDIGIDALTVAETTKELSIGLSLDLAASFVTGPPVVPQETAGDFDLGLSVASAAAKTGNAAVGPSISLSMAASMSAFRDTAGGAFDWQLVAYVPGSTTQYLLPHILAANLSAAISDVGALSLDYPIGGVNATILDGYVDVEYQVRKGDTWETPPNFRFSRMEKTTDFINERGQAVRRYTFQSYGTHLGGIIQEKVTGLDANGERSFGSASIASVVKTIINEAKTGGALPGLQFENESGSTKRLPNPYPPGKDVLSILRESVDQGLCEWLVEKNASGNEARTLVIRDTVGTDRSTGNNPVRLVEGDDITAAPSRVSNADMASKVMVQGDDGRYLTITNAGADIPYGHKTTVVSAGGITDLAPMQIIAQARLDKGAKPRAELTREIKFDRAQWLPFIDYGLGDRVLAQDHTGDYASLRVRQISLTIDGQGTLTGNLVLNDRFVEANLQMAQKVKQLSGSGNAAGGGGRAPIPAGTDKRIIKAPTAFAIQTLPYLDGSVPKALINAGWTNPTQATDNTAMDPASIQLYGRPNSVGEKFRLLTSTDFPDADISYSPLPANADWQFKIRAIGTNDKRSAFSNTITIKTANDSTPPPRPSTPITRIQLAQGVVEWDGGFASAAPMPADFSHVLMHVSSVNGFTPSPANLFDRFTGPGERIITGLPYGSTRYVKFVAYDSTGNASGASNQATVTARALVNTDIIGKIVSGANIVDGSVNAAEKIIGKTITGALIQALTIEAGHIKANAITADKIKAGAVDAAAISATALNGKTITGSTIRTNSGASRIEMTDVGIYQYRSNTAVSTWTPSGFQFRTRTSGARIEFSDSGLRLYNAAGTKTVDLASSGDAAFSGTISGSNITGSTITGGTVRSGSSATRLEMTSAGIKQYKSGAVLTEWSPSGGFIFRSATSGARLTISPNTGIKAFNSQGTETVSISVTGSASFTGTVRASSIIGGTISGGATATGVTIKSSSGSGNNWSGGTMVNSGISGGYMSGTPITGGSLRNSLVENTPYSSGGPSSGDSIDVGYGQLDGGYNRKTSMVFRSGGQTIGGVGGINTGNDRIMLVKNQSGPQLELYTAKIILRATGAGRTIRLETPTVNYTGTLSKASTLATKTDIVPITEEAGLALLSVSPVEYTPIGGGPRSLGVIAEHVEAADLPLLLDRDGEGELRGVAYSEIPMYLLAASRNLLSRIEALEATL